MTLNEIMTAILASFPHLSTATLLKIADLIVPLSPTLAHLGDDELLDLLLSK